ncbi:hypothetical protein Dthio_PD0282 [Desulfonatronospira thiodismutans ASO3-1]|uniref:Uncharacterized protein n=1 Tax=Desulfonatronospira thiodismutans ASO3-1 TaxID=555779 RepID=D6SUI8_9BACT|nr:MULTISPECIES: hypothetical protein [Desulfonatronospira]EFI32968.1 hypothetical protein Dthio_PD0282 [Desulfonatronospira thiodismutans ASO3-1]RQD74561.1 MAG: hypothetical protein D5S03_10145 [Desulfonatronospira sp. MSAO_Bac3]
MPYIPEKRRQVFDPLLEELSREVHTQGELNYCIYKLSRLIAQRMGDSYDNLSMCSSAMEHAKLEWYRKVLAPYEDEKIREHGDI